MTAPIAMGECGLCLERVELAAIAVHLQLSHDVDTSALSTARVEDLTRPARPVLVHQGEAYARASGVQIWLSRREIRAALTEALRDEDQVHAVGSLRTLERAHAAHLTVAQLCLRGRDTLLEEHAAQGPTDWIALVDARITELFPELTS